MHIYDDVAAYVELSKSFIYEVPFQLECSLYRQLKVDGLHVE